MKPGFSTSDIKVLLSHLDNSAPGLLDKATQFCVQHCHREILPERVLSQVLAALQSAHDRGYMHRDIKPANILFRNDASVVLTDFGIARVIGEDSGLTVAGSVLGTPRYMSPEQARGDRLDHRSDLYSGGVLFYQMLEKNYPMSASLQWGRR